MKNRNFIKPLFLATSLILSSAVLVGCNNSDKDYESVVQSPADILSSTAWETTDAKNAAGEQVQLTDPNVMNFVGYADFKADGTFNMWNLDGTAKMQGTWSLSQDGKTRTINAMNDAGEVLFTRVVDITVLNSKEFTYRIYPDANNKAVFYDIVHTPVTQKTVLSTVLSSTAWETTDAKNAAGDQVQLTDPNVMNFVGYADFKADGTFNMWNLDGTAKMQGTWSLSQDGKTRTINAMNDKGEVLFTRVVDITVLNSKEFTYRIYPDANNKAVYYDIVHTPVSQKVVGSSILSSTTWETTAAVNQAGQNLPLNDKEVINFVGYADFYVAGNFNMTNLDASPKLNGTWFLSDDAKQRTIQALNPQGEVLFTRVVDITVLTPQEFTYRIYPVAADQTQYIDIVHTPIKK